MFIKYQINDFNDEIKNGVINVSLISLIEEDLSSHCIRIFLVGNESIEFMFDGLDQTKIAYLSFIEALQCVGTNHEFIKLTVIPNF